MSEVVLVTGATGCVGANLVKHLNARQIVPRVLLRPSSLTTAIADLQWEPVLGDLTEPDSLAGAVEGCTSVHHAAAMVTFWQHRRPEAERVNVQGTRDLIAASRRAGVRSFVYTSSMAAVGFCEEGQTTVDEDSPWNYRPFDLVYHGTKQRAEALVLTAASDGFKTAAINPGLIFGERDVNLNAARIFAYLGKFPILFTNPGSVVISDADDVAAAHLLAHELGRPGHRYIVGSTSVTYRQLLTWCAELVGARPPLGTVPAWAVRVAGIAGDAYGLLSGREPPLTSDMALAGCRHERADFRRAREELGLQPTDPQTSLEKSYRWALEHGII